MPFDPYAGMFGAPAGSGVLAQPPTATSPIQSPFDPAGQQKLIDAVAALRARDTALKQQYLRAAVMRAMTDPNAVRGAGPAGIRIGEGPGGWATSLGDLAAAYVRAKALQRGGEGIVQATGEQAPAEQEVAAEMMRRWAEANHPDLSSLPPPNQPEPVAPPLSFAGPKKSRKPRGPDFSDVTGGGNVPQGSVLSIGNADLANY